MRTLGFRSNVLFIIAACAGLIASLGRDWYAPEYAVTVEEARIGDVTGPVEGFFSRLLREFTATDGVSGWVAFTTTDSLLCGLAALTVVTAIMSIVPGAEAIARDVLRAAALAMLGVVVVKIARIPEAAGLAERRQGAWIALGVVGIAASSAFTLANAPIRRRRVGPSLYDTPAPAPPLSSYYASSSPAPPAATVVSPVQTAGSTPPQGPHTL